MAKIEIPEVTNIEYWQDELPVGSRISCGVWGRGTVIDTEIKKPVYGGKSFYSIIAKFDGDRYNLSHRGTVMSPKDVRKLKDDAVIKFGSYARGREKPYTYIKYGDIVRYASGYEIGSEEWVSEASTYIVKGGVYNGRIHKNYLVQRPDLLWCEPNMKPGVWVDNNEFTTQSKVLELVKAHDPYHNREGEAPDDVRILIRDRLSNKEHRKRRKVLERLFFEAFELNNSLNHNNPEVLNNGYAVQHGV